MPTSGGRLVCGGLVVATLVLSFGGRTAAGLPGPGHAGPASDRAATLRCAPKHYRVRAGDTLSGIARRFKVSVEKLASANALDPGAVLPIGLALTIPQRDCLKPTSALKEATSGSSALAAALDHAIATQRVSRVRSGVVVVDLAADAVVYRLNPDKPLEPASTEKLPLATAALLRLGSGFRTSTDVLGEGRLVGFTWRGSLILKGYGDPALTTTGLKALAHAVRRHGITAITGGVVGDESYFDGVRTAPGWKASFAKNESPLLSALVVDRGRLDGASVNLPALAAAILFTRALIQEGVSVSHGPTVGRASSHAIPITRRASPPLIKLLSLMDTWSDNFIAEMLLKQLAARISGHGTTGAGARIVASTLAENLIPLQGVRLVDGSGLSPLDRLTARTLAATLETIAHTTALRRLLDTFAIAGATGTLRHRLLDIPNHRLVRGKTGTTDHSSALAGFVGSRFAFAILCNGTPVDWSAAHRLQDRIAETLIAAAD